MMRMSPLIGAHPHFVYKPLAKGLFWGGGRGGEGLSVSLHSTRRVRVTTPPDTHCCKRDAGRREGSDTCNSVKWVQITRIWFICIRVLSYNFVLSKKQDWQMSRPKEREQRCNPVCGAFGQGPVNPEGRHIYR